MNKYHIIIIIFILSLNACKRNEKDFDASGSFEAVERIISAEATGKILSLNIEEGSTLQANDTIGKIDVTNLQLQANQIEATINAINDKTTTAAPQIEILNAQINTQKSQIATLEQQLTVLNKEVLRFQNLVNANAAPKKQLDDLVGQQEVLQKQIQTAKKQISVLNAQIQAAQQTAGIQNKAILSEKNPGEKKLDIIKNQISDGTIINEFKGTVLTQYAYSGEFTTVGKPLYKIADLSTIILRVYVTGNQLAKIKLNDTVEVLTDDGNNGFNSTKGIITWISNKAEFTPKTIQTKEDRANMVYAVKIKVQNNGAYKIGMYGEIKFINND
ncbi:MAG: HlyD family efflux transporter periplasmic adaptor subunit [Chitinophagales bacterium]|nr:HlyD family efflux transporter periplasmic adaptor subunit [Chitinophagales bacterium]